MSPTLRSDVRPLSIAAPVTCPVSEEQAHALLDDELSDADVAAVRQHLARCAGCRARVSRLARFLAAVRRQRRLVPGAPETLRARVRALGLAPHDDADADAGAGADGDA